MNTKKEKSRRKFIKNAGKVAVIAPAAAVILNASTVSAGAPIGSGGSPQCDASCFPG